MRLHEHEAKKLLKERGLSVPAGWLARTPEEARIAAEDIGLPVMIKSQVLVGGRGKAGGVSKASTLDGVEKVAEELLSRKIKDHHPEGVLVEKTLDIERELYCGITIDRAAGRARIMLSSRGGVDIEEAAEGDPDAIGRLSANPLSGPRPFEILELLKGIGLTGRLLLALREVVMDAFKVFARFGALTVEINPLVITSNGEVTCADAVVELDDAALFRFPELAALRMNRMDDRRKRLCRKGATFVPMGRQCRPDLQRRRSGAGLHGFDRELRRTVSGQLSGNRGRDNG